MSTSGSAAPAHHNADPLLGHVALACGAATVGLAGLAILGWTTPARRLASIDPGYIPMAPSTALAFVLLGGAVLCRAVAPSRSVAVRCGTVAALLVCALAGARLIGDLAGWPPTLDEVLVPHPGRFASVPTGRMSPLTAAGFLLGSASLVALLATRARPAMEDAGGFLASLLLLLSVVVTLGYCYGTPLLYGGAIVPMALTTALAFAALSAGLIALAGGERFPLRPLRGPSAQARLLRAFLPIAPAVVITDGLFFRFVHAPNPALRAALLALLLALVVTLGVAQAAHLVGGALDRAEEERRARDRAEREMRELDGRYRMLFDSNPHPMWVYDSETLGFLAVNAAAIRHYGYSREEFLGMTVKDIRPAEDVAAFMELVSTDLPSHRQPGVWRHRRKDGSVIQVEISSQEVVFGGRRARLVLATDITEQRRLEEQLRQSQKMEAVGRLAGGIAHDFNNLLGVVTGYADLLLREIEPGDRRRRRVDQIQSASAKAAALTRQLLALSRKQMLQPRVLELNAVVEDVEKILRRLIGEDIQLITILGAKLGRVKVDPGQTEQVILNLAVNARDAMPRGGKLILETANVELDESYARSRSGVRPGPYVMLAVSDTGCGMDAATMSRIFEPFFTTKEQGKGTGLGLATVYGIVSQSGGHLAVYSEVGRGTTLKVYLPRTDEPESKAVAAPASEPLRRGWETILLLEDEEALRAVIREILDDAGYAVLESSSPEQAISLARSHAGEIHLLLTDVVMPRMSGRDVALRLETIRPRLRTLYMSGYTNEAIGHHGVLTSGDHFLEKPFTSDALRQKVREVLDSA